MTIAYPSSEEWQVVSGGPSTLVNGHRTLTVQRNAIDPVQVVDGRTRCRRGQVVGQVGDSGNSDEPHLHIQVQNTPTFDVEDRNIRTRPILFDGATVTDPRRGDSVAPTAGSR